MKNCVIYLVKNDHGYINELNESLQSLTQYAEPAFGEPVDLILFVDPGFPKQEVKYGGNLPLIFREVDFTYLPNNLKPEQVPEYFPNPTNPALLGFSIGYRHMCRFYSGALYTEGHLAGYDFYLRLDTDSHFLSSLKYDPFKRVKDKGAVYGYIRQAIQQDHPGVCMGLHDEVLNWVRIHGTWPMRLRSHFVRRNRMFYTNFEVGSVSFFSSKLWADYFTAIEKSNGIFLARWGDAPIKYLGLRILTRAGRTLPLTDFRYGHGAIYENDKTLLIEYLRRLRAACQRLGL